MSTVLETPNAGVRNQVNPRWSREWLVQRVQQQQRRIDGLLADNVHLRQENQALRFPIRETTEREREIHRTAHDRKLLAQIADLTGPYDLELLSSCCRLAPVVRVRHACMARLREHGYSLREIGDFFHRDHTSVTYALRKGHVL